MEMFTGFLWFVVIGLLVIFVLLIVGILAIQRAKLLGQEEGE